MLDGALLDTHVQRRQPLADLLDPLVSAQDSQRLRHRLVKGFGGHLDCMLGTGEVAAGDLAGAEGHGEQGSTVRLLFATESWKERAGTHKHF